MNIETEVVGIFEGVTGATNKPVVGSPRSYSDVVREFFNESWDRSSAYVHTGMDMLHGREQAKTIASHDVPLHYYYNKVMSDENDADASDALEAHIAHRNFFDSLFAEVYPEFDEENFVSKPEDFDCLRFLIDATEEHCGRLDDYTLKFVKRMVHTCEIGTPEEIGEAAELTAFLCDTLL